MCAPDIGRDAMPNARAKAVVGLARAEKHRGLTASWEPYGAQSRSVATRTQALRRSRLPKAPRTPLAAPSASASTPAEARGEPSPALEVEVEGVPAHGSRPDFGATPAHDTCRKAA